MSKKVYMIGNAHLDPVWLWKRREGYAEIKATYQSALDRMEQFDDYIFTAACASYYRWIEVNEPAMFRQIQKRVAEGRWAIVGGMWVQPDVNMPSGESLARHFLYSQRYFLEKFGRIATIGYNVDSFGHNSMLPQLLKKAGMNAYVMMRPDAVEQNLPFLFTWEAPDGSKVDVFRISQGYCDMHWGYDPQKYPGLSTYQAKAQQVKRIAEADGVPHMLFYGVGNHGGGATVRCLKELDAITAVDSDTVYASPEDYFRDVKADNLALPVVRRDLQNDASGCYAASSATKKKHRRTENRLVSAEKYDVLAAQLVNSPSKRDELKKAYEKLLFNQFHDILCGCSIEEGVEEALAYFDAAWAEGEDVAEFALQKMSWNIDTAGGIQNRPDGKINWLLWETEAQGAPLVVFNPHSFPVSQTIRINHADIRTVTDENGEPLPVQYLHGALTNREQYYFTSFTADVPALGYRTYYLYTQKEMKPTPPDTPVTAGEDFLENQFLKVTFCKESGGVTIYDKIREITVMTDGTRALVMDDSLSDTWAHGIYSFNDQIGAFGQPEFDLVEAGPLLATMRITTHYGDSVLIQNFTLNHFSDELRVECELDFRNQRKMVKLNFPISAHCRQVQYEMPFACTSKPLDGREEPGHRYVNLTGENPDGRTVSLAVLNDSKYSFSALDDQLRMAVARGCGYADHLWFMNQPMAFQDQGKQTFRYTLLSHDNDIATVTKRAMALNQELEFVNETNHPGTLPTRFSGIEITAPNVVCETIKFAEAEDALILRVYETAGQKANATIALRIPGYTLDAPLSFTEHEVKTIRINKNGEVKETNLLEMETKEKE